MAFGVTNLGVVLVPYPPNSEESLNFDNSTLVQLLHTRCCKGKIRQTAAARPCSGGKRKSDLLGLCGCKELGGSVYHGVGHSWQEARGRSVMWEYAKREERCAEVVVAAVSS